jgi:hypothetical protein
VAAITIGAAILALGVGVAAVRAGPDRPVLHFADPAPDDLRELATRTWARFLDSVPARWDCLSDVTLQGAWTFRVRASYDPDRGVVTLRIPGTAPNLAASMVHEFAHHLEFSCPGQREFRSAFMQSQGIPPGTRWRGGPEWSAIPSEQYAQAMIRLVLGPQPNPLVAIRPAALAALRAWARDD